MLSEPLSTLAGPAGVGALCLLGVFLFLDGIEPTLFPTVERYATTATWGVIAAVPVLVIAYVLGLFVNAIAVLVVRRAFGVDSAAEIADIVQIGSVSVEKSSAVQHFLQVRQDRAVLAGCSVAFIALSAGALSELSNLPNVGISITILASGAFLLGALLFWLAGAKTLESHQLAAKIVEIALETPSELHQ